MLVEWKLRSTTSLMTAPSHETIEALISGPLASPLEA
jgi:hypothetical protein